MATKYFLIVSEQPNARDAALDSDATVVGNRVEHPRGVRAYLTAEDAVDPHFGPPAYPFDLLQVSDPVAATVHADETITARSWSVRERLGAAAVFGPNGNDVVEKLRALGEPLPFDAESLSRAVALFTVALGRSRARGSQAERPGWHTTSASRANDSATTAGRCAALAARSVIWETLTSAVPNTWAQGPDRESAADLVGSAVAWGTDGTSGPNPYAEAIPLARMGVFAAVSPAALTLWKGGEVVSRTGLLVTAAAPAVASPPRAEKERGSRTVRTLHQ